MTQWEPRLPPGSFNRQGFRPPNTRQVFSSSLENESDVVKCKIYFTNFPDVWESCHFWEIFKSYGEVVDIYIPANRNARGQRFGFISFLNCDNVVSLLASLNQVWIGGFKLRFYMAKGVRGPNVNCQSNLKHEEIHKTYAKVVKGTNDDSHAYPNAADQCKSKQPYVGTKSNSMSKSLANDVVCSLINNCADSHVEVSLKNGVLTIKINILELLSSLKSDSEDSQSSTGDSKSSTHDSQKIELPLVASPKGVSSNNDTALVIKQRPRQDKSKSLALPLGPLWTQVFPYSSTKCSGGKLLLNGKANSSPLKANQSFSNSSDSLKASNTIFDQGVLRHDSDSADLGSPCFSVHTRSTGDFNMSFNEDQVDKEMPNGYPQVIDDKTPEVQFNELEIIDPNAVCGLDNEHVFVDGSDEDWDNTNMIMKKSLRRKKKKRKNYKWSKKKTHTTGKVRVPSPPKLTVEDTCISEPCDRDEAFKTLEVARLLGISFMDEDEAIINKLLELELKERNEHERT